MSVRDQYRALWSQGLRGGCNYYRASPLRPPTATDQAVLGIEFPPDSVTVKVPTRVIWGEDDIALPIGLLEGLEAFVPDMDLVRVPGASHWIIHERPASSRSRSSRRFVQTLPMKKGCRSSPFGAGDAYAGLTCPSRPCRPCHPCHRPCRRRRSFLPWELPRSWLRSSASAQPRMPRSAAPCA